MKKEFKLEVGIVAMPEGTSSEDAIEISKAVSLRRIADALDILTNREMSKPVKSIFDEIFSSNELNGRK